VSFIKRTQETYKSELLEGQEFSYDYDFQDGLFVIIYSKGEQHYQGDFNLFKKKIVLSRLTGNIIRHSSKKNPYIHFFIIGRHLRKHSLLLNVRDVHFHYAKSVVKINSAPKKSEIPANQLIDQIIKTPILLKKTDKAIAFKKAACKISQDYNQDLENFKKR